MNRTSLARPLAAVFSALVVYASLYPFTGWRTQDDALLSFMLAPLPRYWTVFDVVSNLLGYMPLGLLLAVAALRTSGYRRHLVWAFLLPCVLSLTLESLQVYLPQRVASNVDWLLNTAGGALGALTGLLLHRLGLIRYWSRLRATWFVPDAHGALLLLALWPVALLYPVSVPLGLGQVWVVVKHQTVDALSGMGLAAWLPAADTALAPLSRLTEALCVALCVVAPALLGFSVLKGSVRRFVHLVAVLVSSVAVSAFSGAMTYGPTHAWAWLTDAVAVGLVAGAVLSLPLMWLSRRACTVWLILVLLMALVILNQAPLTPYLAESLDVWAQGRFIRFHGLTQWVGWVWPFAALLHALRQASRRYPAADFDHTTQVPR